MTKITKDRFTKNVPNRIEQFDNFNNKDASTLADIIARCTRKDKVDISVAGTWWHEIGSTVDSNGRSPIWVHEKDSGNVTRHVRHYYRETVAAGYKMFLKWKPYLDYLALGNNAISINLFRQGRCPCMRQRDFRSCVDMITVQMEHLLTAHKELTLLKPMQALRKKCKCEACKNDHHPKLRSLKELRHLCLCEKEQHVPYGVQDRLDAPFLYQKRCCVRGEDEDCKGGEKCFVHPSVCKQKHSNVKRGEDAVPLCEECGIERVKFCPLMFSAELSVNVQIYQEVERESKYENDELVSVRMTGKELMERIIAFAPCYFSHYWELKHDRAVENANIQRMKGTPQYDEGGEQKEDVVDIVIQADYASNMEIPNHDMKVCTTKNQAVLEMFCVKHSRRVVLIPEYESKNGKKVIPAHEKVIWTNDIWHFWRPADGTKGANSVNHNHALNHLVDYYKLLFPGRTIRIVMTTDGCRGQYAGRKNFAKIAEFFSKHDGVEIAHGLETIFIWREGCVGWFGKTSETTGH